MNIKTVFFLSFLLVINFQLLAQDSLSVNSHRFSLKVSGALVNGTPYMAGNQVSFVKQRPQMGLSFSYQLLKNLNTSLGVSYLNPLRAIPHQEGNSTMLEGTKSSVWYYGLSFSYDILPVVFNTNHIRFDVYPIVSVTHVREKWLALDSGTPGSATFLEYNGGIGLGYNFNKNVGVFTESLFGKFYNYDKFQLKFGLKYKF